MTRLDDPYDEGAAAARELVPAMADRIEELERELAVLKGEKKW